jgi:hypothetical protein
VDDTPKRKRPPAKPKDDGFVVFEVDGFAQLTPEQRKWPVVSFQPSAPPDESTPNDSDKESKKN